MLSFRTLRIKIQQDRENSFDFTFSHRDRWSWPVETATAAPSSESRKSSTPIGRMLCRGRLPDPLASGGTRQPECRRHPCQGPMRASLKATIAGMSCQTDIDMFVRSMMSWGHISNMTFQPLNSGIGIYLSRSALIFLNNF